MQPSSNPHRTKKLLIREENKMMKRPGPQERVWPFHFGANLNKKNALTVKNDE